MTRPPLGIAYFGNRYAGHARADLAEMAELGATTVVHTFSEADLRWNPATMTELIGIGRALGLDAWCTPWGLGGIFGGEAASYAVMMHPEATQRDQRGAPLPALCLNQPPARTLVEHWLDACALAGASVVTWDEPHLALGPPVSARGDWSCRCDVCQRLYAERFGAPMPAEWTETVAAFQHASIVAALEWMIAEANRRGLQSGLVLLPDEQTGDRDWRTLAMLPGVRWFGVTPYWLYQQVPPAEIEAYLRRWCRRMQTAATGLPVRTVGWIQAFSVPAGRESELTRGIEIMDEEGIDMIAIWAYRACAAMSALAPDDPARVWSTIETAVRARASRVGGVQA